MAHGDPKHPQKNPHPVQRYEVIATADAPGPWDRVSGYMEYQVTNPECTPKNEFEGVHAMPPFAGHEFEMTRVNDTTWKGYFYRDYLQDEDYYGLGLCRWGPASISAVFVTHDEVFGSGSVFDDFMRHGASTEYFKKADFLKRPFKQAYGTAPDDPEVLKNPNAFFSITVAIKEVKP